LELNIFAKTGTRVKLFGVGIEAESKNSNSDHYGVVSILSCCSHAALLTDMNVF